MKVFGEIISIGLGLFVLFGLPHYLGNHWLCLISWFPAMVTYVNISDKFEEQFS